MIKKTLDHIWKLARFPSGLGGEPDPANPGSRAVLYYYCLLSSALLSGLGLFFLHGLNRSGGWILFAPALLLGALAVALRRGFSTRLAAHCVLLSGTSMAFYGANELGGIHSPIALWLVLAPITAGLFLPKRDVAAWVLATVALYGFLGSTEGVATRDQEAYSLTAFITFTLVSLMAFVFTYYFKVQLTAANQRVQRKRDHVENLLRVVGHDIANPLAIIEGTLDLLETDTTGATERQKSHLKRMRRAAVSIHGIITNTRKLTALESGILKVPLEPVDLLECIRNCIQDHKEALTRKSIQVHLQAPGHGVRVVAERISLEHQVLSNLFSNAIKFTPECGKITFIVSIRSQIVYLRICDTGIGIPEHLKGDLFAWGSLTNRKGTQGEGGTGFGLPIARSFVELFGGVIHVESFVGKARQKSNLSVSDAPEQETPSTSSQQESENPGTTFCIELQRSA